MVNLIGNGFILDGELLDDDLTIDQTFTILDHDATFKGLLADGSAFSFDLNSVNVEGEDFYDPSGTLTVAFASVVPTVIPSDVNQDGSVTFADIPAFIEIQTSIKAKLRKY